MTLLDNQTTRVNVSRVKVCLWILLGSWLEFISVGAVVGAWGATTYVERSLGIFVSGAVLLLGLLRTLFLLVSPTPLLILEHEGIRMEPALFGDRLIPWSHVQDVRYRRVKLGIGPMPWAPRYWLRFTVVDAEQFRSSQNVIQRLLAYLWRAAYMTRGEVVLNSGIASMPIRHLYETMRERTSHNGVPRSV